MYGRLSIGWKLEGYNQFGNLLVQSVGTNALTGIRKILKPPVVGILTIVGVRICGCLSPQFPATICTNYQALVLTAIVIGLGGIAFVLALIHLISARYQTSAQDEVNGLRY